MTARAFATRFSIFNALVFIGVGIQLPFLPLWLSAKGLSVPQIATILAGMMACRIFGAPLAAFFADKYQNRRLIIKACAFAAFAAFAVLVFMEGFVPIMIVSFLAAFLFSPVFPLAEGFSVDGSVAHGLDYGRIRLWASLSFLMGSLGGGLLLPHLPAEAAASLIAIAQLIAALATFLLPDEPEKAVAHQDTAPSRLVDIRRLFLSPAFVVFFLAVSIAQSSHALLYTLGSVHWTSLGYDEPVIGLFWTIGVLTEVSLFAFSNAVFQRFGAVLLICIGTSGGVLRWLLMANDLPFMPMALTQTLHAVTFAMTHLGTMHYIRQTVPQSMRNSAQGLYSAFSAGILMSLVAFLSGPLYQAHGGGAYYVMAALSALALVFSIGLLRLNPKAQAEPGSSDFP